jgi:hypothetical protein
MLPGRVVVPGDSIPSVQECSAQPPREMALSGVLLWDGYPKCSGGSTSAALRLPT